MALIDDLILEELFGNGGLNLYFPSTEISEIIHVCQLKIQLIYLLAKHPDQMYYVQQTM